MKKIISLLLTSMLCFSLVACGGNETNTNDETKKTETKTETKTKKTIDLRVDEGRLKYIGVEKANPELIANNDGIDKDKVFILKFEYTNNQEDSSQCQNTFYIQTFQNGIEIKNSLSYNSKGGEQYELVGNFYSEALKGGTITFGRLVVLKDDSPITIIAKENNGKSDGKKQSMELDISKAIGTVGKTKNESKDNEDKEDKEDKEESSQSKTKKQKKATVKDINIGDKIETDNFDFTVNKIELTYTVNPEDTSSVYTNYEADNGKVFVHLDGSYYNKSKRDICVRDLFVPVVDYNNGYTYTGFAAVDNGYNFTWGSSYIVCSPLETCHYHGIVECPAEVENSENPLFITFEINGTIYKYTIR